MLRRRITRPAERIDELVGRYAKYGYLNGAVLVAEQGKIIYEKGIGEANMELHVPNTPRTKFGIASLTKQFTAVLVLQQVAKGGIRLEGKVSDYLPWYRQDTLDPPVSGAGRRDHCAAQRLWVHGTIGTKHSGDTVRHGTKDAITKREGSGGAGMVRAGGMGRVTSHAECACRSFRRSGDPAGGAPKEKNRNSKPGLNRERDSPSAKRRIQTTSRPAYACQASAFQPGLPSRRRNHDPAAFPVDGVGYSS